MNTGVGMNNSVAQNTGYLRPQDALYTPQGQAWAQAQIDDYRRRAGGGWNPDGTALNGSAYGLPDASQGVSSIINWAMQNNPTSMPTVHSAAWDMAQNADKLARDLQASQAATQRYVTDTNAALQRDLQAGLITHQQAMQASQQAHEKALQAEQMAYKYAELSWTKEYGTQNLQILRDRLALDKEGQDANIAIQNRLAAVQEGRLGLEKDQFGLNKNIEEAKLKANPFNAVANALYMRGKSATGGVDQYGAPNSTLDNSGVLPFLQQLQGGTGIQNPIQFGGQTPLNQQGIGGNTAPNPNQISQASFGNMSNVERGVTTSLAQYGGYDPQDYWNQMQRSWNTAGQGGMNFATRMA